MATTTIDGVSWGYQRGDQTVSVLSNINLTIQPGEVVALVGQSGSGKSSLLNIISGIQPIQQGEVTLDQFALSQMDEEQRTAFRKKHIGFVYQSFNLIPTLTVKENIALVLSLNNVPAKETEQRVIQQLELLGLADKADTFPDVLSGGEQQRVAIARALIHQPRLVLADEPTGNLDAKTGQNVLELLLDNAKHHNSSVLLVTHSHRVAQQADRIVGLVDGELVDEPSALAW